MMKTKALIIILSTMILFLCSKSNPISAKLADIELLEADGAGGLQKFLANVKSNGSPLHTEDCLPNSVFQIKKITITPPEIIVGDNLHIKAIGAMSQDSFVSKLKVDAFLNGEIIFNQEVQKGVLVKKGLWFYEYEVGVPTFVPTGHWEIFAYVISDKNENLNCLKATFDT